MLSDETMRGLGWSPELILAVRRVTSEVDRISEVIPSVPGVFSDFEAAYITSTIEPAFADAMPTSTMLVAAKV